MATVEHLVETEAPQRKSPEQEPTRKTRTPEERRVEVCPVCFTALPAATAQCFFCE